MGLCQIAPLLPQRTAGLFSPVAFRLSGCTFTLTNQGLEGQCQIRIIAVFGTTELGFSYPKREKGRKWEKHYRICAKMQKTDKT